MKSLENLGVVLVFDEALFCDFDKKESFEIEQGFSIVSLKAMFVGCQA